MHVLRRLREVLVGIWRTVVPGRTVVFVLDRPPLERPELPNAMRVVRCAYEKDVPPEFLGSLLSRKGARYLKTLRDEMSRRGVLWLASIEGELAAFQWSRRGRDITHWYIPVDPADVLIFSTVTFESFRGHGIAPLMMRYIIAEELAGDPGARALVDCKEWNARAARFIQKAGFRRICDV